MKEQEHILVEVRLFAKFREGRFKKSQLELPGGSCLSDLLEHLKIPEKDARIFIVNGLAVSVGHKLNPSDVVAIFPLVAGG